MSGSSDGAMAHAWNPWRIARWTAALALLLTPLAMMQVSDQWHWNVGSFVFAAIAIGSVGLLYEVAERLSGSRAYRLGVAVALLASFLVVWATLVRDDGNGIGFLLLVPAAAVAAFAAWFRPAGMARAALGVGAMHGLLGIAMATAPSQANEPGGSIQALLFGGFFTALWLISAGLFRAAAKREHGAPSVA